MKFPEHLKYSENHRWVEKNGDQYKIGMTPILQDELGEISFIDLPEVGREVVAGDSFIDVEAAKAVTELMLPLSGTVVAVNEALSDSPELLSEDAYQDAWLVVLDHVSEADYEALLDAAAYENLQK